MKKLRKILALALALSACMAIAAMSGTASRSEGSRADIAPAPSPKPSPTPSPSPVPVRDEDNRVEVLDVSALEDRVKELHKLGYEVRRNNILVSSKDKVILFLDPADLHYAEEEDDECESGAECD
jgi:hypothetical protein